MLFVRKIELPNSNCYNDKLIYCPYELRLYSIRNVTSTSNIGRKRYVGSEVKTNLI